MSTCRGRSVNRMVVVATESDIQKALDRYYTESTESFETIVEDLTADDALAREMAVMMGDGKGACDPRVTEPDCSQ